MYNFRMKQLHENVNHLMLALIVGIASLGVSFIGDMSTNLQAMAVSVHELNAKMGAISETTRDHEARIREIEKETFSKGN
jgi:methyl-accepting chemotaxis protein